MNRVFTIALQKGFVACLLLAISSYSFAVTTPDKDLKFHSPVPVKEPEPTPLSFLESKKELFDRLCLNDLGLSRKVFELALKGMDKLLNRDLIKHHILSIADFSKPSLVKRLFVIDLDLEELLFNTWVTHGRNSGALLPQYFSNKPRSKKSSLGFFVTGAPYNGSNGYSLRLQGLEPGFNTNAGMRGIVVHGSRYVGEDYIEQKGTVGRSLGCPAVPAEISESLINTIKEGSCLFIYHPSPNYLHRSTILK